MSVKDNLSIMVVDDTAVSRALIVNTLEEIGMKKIVHENNGKDAYQAIAKQPVHLVVSDYNMPEMDGLHLLKALRANGPTAKIGFILVTGTEDPKVIAAGKQLGMNNYLPKPFDKAGMTKCLEAVVGKL